MPDPSTVAAEAAEQAAEYLSTGDEFMARLTIERLIARVVTEAWCKLPLHKSPKKQRLAIVAVLDAAITALQQVRQRLG